MKWDIPGDLPVVVANADGIIEDCGICGGRHRHGSAQPDSDYQRCGLLGPGYYYVNNPTRSSGCPSSEYSDDYLLAYGMGEGHPYLDESERREPPRQRTHDTYKENHWKVLDVDGVDNLFSTYGSDKMVRIDFDGVAAQSVMRDLATEGDNVNVSAWFSIEDAEELVDQLEGAIEQARKESEKE